MDATLKSPFEALASADKIRYANEKANYVEPQWLVEATRLQVTVGSEELAAEIAARKAAVEAEIQAHRIAAEKVACGGS